MPNAKISALTPVTSLAGDELIPVVQTGTNKTTTPAQVEAFLNGRETRVKDLVNTWFAPTRTTLDTTGGQISGDPFIIRDEANSQWIMYLFRTVAGSPYVRVYYRTVPFASTLLGTWSAATEVASLSGYHKAALLVDVDGTPVQVSGTYRLYAVSYTGTLSTKEIWQFTSASLTGPWGSPVKVIAKGVASSLDEFNTDTPYAVLDNGTIHMWYMGAPTSSQVTYGLAVRMLKATATDPAGPFTKSYTDVIAPATAAAWNYGWMGGTQVRRRPGGGYVMVYNAGDTRPVTAGAEPDSSRAGYAYSSSLNGPWTQDPLNPYFNPVGWPTDGSEANNIWRTHVAFDHLLNDWVAFYNTGVGTEVITQARPGVYEYQSIAMGSPFNVQNITTSLVSVANSRVNLAAGTYIVRYQVNLIANSSTVTLLNLDVDTSLRINGVVFRTNRDFIGNYAYENRDTVLEYPVTLTAPGYVDLAVQVTAGTPTVNSYIRRLRVTAQKV